MLTGLGHAVCRFRAAVNSLPRSPHPHQRQEQLQHRRRRFSADRSERTERICLRAPSNTQSYCHVSKHVMPSIAPAHLCLDGHVPYLPSMPIGLTGWALSIRLMNVREKVTPVWLKIGGACRGVMDRHYLTLCLLAVAPHLIWPIALPSTQNHSALEEPFCLVYDNAPS